LGAAVLASLMCRHLAGQLPVALVLLALILFACVALGISLVRKRSASTRNRDRPPMIVVFGELIGLVVALLVAIAFVVRCV